MVADASIYGLIKQPEGPLDQYGKVLNLKALMGQGRLQELQTQAAERTAAQDSALDQVFANAPAGATLESLVPDAIRANPRAGIDLQGKMLTQKETQGKIAHTAAQTGDITAGHLAGAWAALAKGGGSDESVKNAEGMMAPLFGQEKAAEVSQKLLSMPAETRLAYAVAQAGQHKTGQEALKLFFPNAAIRDTGGEVQPVSTSTLPGGPVAGTPIPGSTPIAKTATPGEKLTDARQRELNGILEDQSVDTSALAKEIAGHRQPMPVLSTRNVNNPAVLARYSKLVADVKAINPNWGAEQFPVVKSTENAFVNGKPGATIQAISNATGHLDTYERLALAMKNGDTQGVNAIVNKAKEQFGSAAPTTPQAVSQLLSAEIVKAISGGPGALADREHAQEIFSNKKSPSQMLEANEAIRELMGQQFRSLEQKYSSGTYGRKDFADKYLTLPEVRAAYDKAVKSHSAPADVAKAQPGKLTQPVKFLGFE